MTTTADGSTTQTADGSIREKGGIELLDQEYFQYNFHKGFGKQELGSQFFDSQSDLPIDMTNGGIDINRGMQITNRRWVTFNIPMLDAISRDNAMVKNAVNYLSSKPIINGIDINILNDNITSEDIFLLQKDFKSLYPAKKQILTKGFFYGGSAGLLWFEGEETQSALLKPLIIENIKVGSFQGIIPLSRWYQIEPDLQSGLIKRVGKGTGFDDARWIGKPLYYNVNISGGMMGDAKNKNFRVHASRLLLFHTEMPSYIETQVERYWGASLIEVAWNALKNDERLWSATVKTGERNNMMILKLKNLAMTGNITSNAKKNFQTRMEFMGGASAKNVLPIDKEDELEFANAQLAGQSEILEQDARRVAGALKVPVSVIFPNINADKEDSSYIQSLATLEDLQENVLREWDNKILRIQCKSRFNKTLDNILFNYNAIETLTTKEKAEIANINADTIGKLFENDVIDSASAIKMVDDIAKNPVNFSQHITPEYRNDIINKAKNGEFVTKSSIQIEVSKILNQQQMENGKGVAGSANPESSIKGKKEGGKPSLTKKNPIDLQK